MSRSSVQSVFWTLAILPLILSGGCLSLSEDITPPPARKSSPHPTLDVNRPTATPMIGGGQDLSEATESNPTPQGTLEERMGKVTVDIRNQSEDQTLNGLAQVTLNGFDHMNQVFRESRPLNGGGRVTFREVPFVTGRMFFASISYQGAVYRSDVVELEPEVSSLDLAVDVYGTTTDQSALSIERMHLIVDIPTGDTAQFAEIFIISNFGEKTVVSAEGEDAVLHFPLPENAQNLEFRSGALGERFIKTEGGFADTLSIPPGSGVYQLLVFFETPYENGRMKFEQKMNLPVGAVVVLTPSSGVTLRGNTFRDQGIREVQEGAIHVYAGDQLSQGEVLTFSLSGRPSQPSAEPHLSITRRNTLIGLSVFGGVLLLAGIWLYVRTQREDDGEITRERVEANQEEILDAIIALDDLYEAGEIAEDAYRDRRSALKSRLEKMVVEGGRE